MNTKTCSKCKAVKPASAFRVDPGNTSGLQSQCRECQADHPNAAKTRPYTAARAARTRARGRALARLAEHHAAEYEALYREELAAATAEAEALAKVAEQKAPGTGHDHGGGPVVPLLKRGVRRQGQTVVDRLRDDVGRCAVCIDAHDRGHVCPACGEKPTASWLKIGARR